MQVHVGLEPLPLIAAGDDRRTLIGGACRGFGRAFRR